MAGANLNYGSSRFTLFKFLRLLLIRRNGLARTRGGSAVLCTKAGAPANNTVADNPNGVHNICYDTTNDRAYLCTLYSSDASATTWTRIDG